ncbi:MAG: hypothetical protein AAGK69_13125, partial [Pseudomonadota bacterium]
MHLEPLLNASLPIQIHVALALMALMLGPVVLWRNRRDRVHRVLGYVWAEADRCERAGDRKGHQRR